MLVHIRLTVRRIIRLASASVVQMVVLQWLKNQVADIYDDGMQKPVE